MPDNSHLEAMQNAPAPSDASTLRLFLGLTAWYAKFIPSYAAVFEPMRAQRKRKFHMDHQSTQKFPESERTDCREPCIGFI